MSVAPMNSNVIAPGGRLETRYIFVAQGIQFTNADMAAGSPPEPYGVLPDALTAPAGSRSSWHLTSLRARAPFPVTTDPTVRDAIRITSPTNFEYTSSAQGVKFVVSILTSKDAYRNALLTANAHVIYDGHARWGRGPCFGILPNPGTVSHTEDWETGTSNDTGIFRMGFPFLSVTVDEVFEHGYTANPVSSDVTLKPDLCDPDLRNFVTSLKAVTAAQMGPPSAANPSGLIAQLKDKDPSKTWWAYRAPDSGKIVWWIVLNAGWTGTPAAPYDLGATTPTCRVFCHFGCETFHHNHSILRSDAFKAWKRTGDDKFAYFTTSLSTTGTTTYWLYHLLTYSTANAYLDWKPSIEYALRNTNADLAHDGARYQLI
jgi:hypothetical protein